MKPRNAEGARLETDYLYRVREALRGREASEVEEVLQSLREHIDEELSQDLDGEIGLVQMANVLERLGPPEAYVQEEVDGKQLAATGQKMSGQKMSEGKRISRLAIASALCLPLGILGGVLVGFLAHVASGRERVGEAAAWLGVISGVMILFLGLILGVAALRAIRTEPNTLSGRGLAWVGILQLPIILFFVFLWFAHSESPERPASHDDAGPPVLNQNGENAR